MYDFGACLVGGENPRIAAVIVSQLQNTVGEWSLQLSPDGSVGSPGGLAVKPEAIPDWLATQITAAHWPDDGYYGLWLTVNKEQETPVSALAKAIGALEFGAAKALPDDSTLTIFIVLDSLDKALNAKP